MKDLTHYFTSPKGKEKNVNLVIQSEDSNDSNFDVTENLVPLPKKPKLRLSKSKLNEIKSTNSIKSNVGGVVVDSDKKEINGHWLEKNSNSKKRKRLENSETLPKKLKTSKTTLKSHSSKSDDIFKKEISNGVVKHNSDESCIGEDEKDTVIIDTSTEMGKNSLCNKSDVKIKKGKKSKKLLIESDEDTCDVNTVLKEIDTSLECLDNLNDEKSTKSSRNSLFSYFNKVNKEIALKEKVEKIKVEVLIHKPPDKKSERKPSSLRLSATKKPRKLKSKKMLLDDSDSIELLSSEYITDENNSISINSQVGEKLEEQDSVKDVKNGLTEKINTTNIASIFVQKKINENHDKSGQCCSIKTESQTGKEEKDSETKTRCLKLKSVPITKEEHYISEAICSGLPENEKQLDKSRRKNKSPLKKSKEVNSLKLSEKTADKKKKKLNEKLDDKISPERNSTKMIVTLKTNKEPNVQKPVNINGFFSPKHKKLTDKKSVENYSDSKKTKNSPWVMKVRLNSNTPVNSPDSEDNSRDETKLEDNNSSEISEDTTEKDDNPDIDGIVLLDDDSSSESIQEITNTRKSLPRCAKNAKPTDMKEETILESPKQPVKIWPFFQKGGARKAKEPVEDEAKLQARKLFLGSGVPDSIKKKVGAVKNEITKGDPAPFPVVSHVTSIMTLDLPSSECRLPALRSPDPILSLPPWRTVCDRSDCDEPEIPVFQRPENIKVFLEKLKEEEPKTEVKALYKRLKEYKAKADTDVWTDIYRPIKAADMVGNSESIKKLKTWLETLKNRRKREGSVSSGDEFVDEDSEESNAFNNMAIITGPYGCGKTAAVYAIANELDCKVLEINASCNRSGKRILAEFSESTQSHQVERTQALNGLLNKQNGRKSKKKKKSKLSEAGKSEKTSLILVEDADLLFCDIDEGFMQALSSLAATSKRPLILVTNQTKNPHLERFQNSRLLSLTFTRPKAAKLGLWLRLVGLVEGVAMTADQASRLVYWSQCDVRRSLMQLQLMVHSNNSEISEPIRLSELWWRWPAKHKMTYELPTLLEPEEPPPPTQRNKKQLLDQLQAVASTTSQLATLDTFTPQNTNGSREDDPCPLSWRSVSRESTALAPHCHDNDVFGPRQELATWLAQAVVNGIHQPTERLGQSSQEARWLSILRQTEQYFMAGVSPMMHTNHISVSCDYMPYLRDLGRAEEVRLAHYTRRANRFFNYLQGLGIHASKSFRDFMCDAFS